MTLKPPKMRPSWSNGGDQVSGYPCFCFCRFEDFQCLTFSGVCYECTFGPPAVEAGNLFANMGLIPDYLGIIIPLAIAAAASSLMCLVSAKEAGDPYPVRESMIADGIGTCAASFFGSPFGTVIYVSLSQFISVAVMDTPCTCPLIPHTMDYFVLFCRLVILHTNDLERKWDIRWLMV